MAEQELKISLDEKTAGGHYSNIAMISHSENEFVVDFIFAHPPQGKVNSRIILSPSHAKRLVKALKENIDIFEKKFGNIKETPIPPNLGINLSTN